MVKVTKDLVKHLENLARLELTEEQRIKIMKDMEEILEYMEMLDEVDVKDVDPMYTPIENPVLLRRGEPRTFEGVDHIRKNFPREDKGHIKVPGIHR